MVMGTQTTTPFHIRALWSRVNASPRYKPEYRVAVRAHKGIDAHTVPMKRRRASPGLRTPTPCLLQLTQPLDTHPGPAQAEPGMAGGSSPKRRCVSRLAARRFRPSSGATTTLCAAMAPTGTCTASPRQAPWLERSSQCASPCQGALPCKNSLCLTQKRRVQPSRGNGPWLR